MIMVDRFGSGIGRLFALGMAFLALFPLLYALLISVVPSGIILAREPRYWPWSLDNYISVFIDHPFAMFVVNSMIVCLAITAGAMVTSILAAYVFARAQFRGRDALFMIVLATLMIPGHITLIPNYLTMGSLGLLDTYTALILPFIASGFATFFLRQHFRTISPEIDAAARVDGATPWRILWDIIVPMSRPAIATIAVFVFLSEWNSYIWPLIVTDSDSVRTVQIGISRLYLLDAEDGLIDWPLVMAGSVVAMLPPIIAFFIAEKHLVRGLALGGSH